MLNKCCILFLISFVSNFIVATEIYFVQLETLSYYGIYFLVFLYLLICGFRTKKILDRKCQTILLLFFLPIALSAFGVAINSFLISDIHYSFQILLNGLPRLVNYLLMFTVFIVFVPVDDFNSVNSVKWFCFSLFVFLLFGIWQFFHFHFNVPIIPFETRDMAHSVVGVAPTHRLTSIAREPSFFSPLLAEMFILSFFLRDLGWSKLLIIILRSLVLFVAAFTLSPSTYMEFFFVFLVILFRNRVKFSTVVVVTTLVVSVVYLYQYLDDFIFYRIMTVSDSTRYLQIETIFKTMFDMNFFTLFFGVGPKGLFYISQIAQIDGTGAEIHASTNNIFADLFVDNGLFGIICLCALFFYLYKKSFSVKLSNLPAMFFVHIFICCQYRGNYSSIRFIMLIVILLTLINYYSNRELKVNHE